ncbi:uncharacterized protein [Rutidosis leptorrhynchoides]|uniref:uncharacterized protein n=1 Tax=Rutidosis leptorrhynchoides TaxID=125765 RepID=UPI003A996DE7
MSNSENDGWEYLLDIDDSDITYIGSQRTQPVPLTSRAQTTLVSTPLPVGSAIRSPPSPQPTRKKQKQPEPCTPPRPMLRGSGSNKTNQLSYRIPGPAGVFQDAYELRNNENNVVDEKSTQDFIREVINKAEFDDSFTKAPWINAMEFAYPYGGRSNIADILSQRKCYWVDQVVGVIKTCAPNVVGDLSITLKDTTGTIKASISSKIIDGVQGKYEGVKGIREGAVLVIQNCSIFCPSSYVHYLNITRRSLVKVFLRDGGSA